MLPAAPASHALAISVYSHSAMLFSISSFPVTRTQYSTKGLKMEGFIGNHTGMLQSITVGRAWRQGHGAAGHVASGVRKAREMSAHTFSFFCLEPQAMGWCHSSLVQFFPPRLT